MSEKLKKTMILVLLVFTFIDPLRAEQGKVDFDPFPAETNLSTASNKSISGPVIPQVEFNNNDISMAFQIISDATGWSIFPTADVSKAKINLWAKNISAQQLLDTVITMAGFVCHKDGDVITVMTYDEYMQYYGLAKQVFSLEYATAASVDASIKPFLTKLGKSVVHTQTNTIVLYEADANLKFIESVVKKIDSPSENVIVEVINLKYADSEALGKILQSIYSNQNKEFRNKSIAEKAKEVVEDQTAVDLPGEGMEIHAITNANQLVVVGTLTDIEKVKKLVAMVDVYGDNMALEVIDLKYADSELLAEKLRQLFTDEKKRELPTSKERPATGAADSEITQPVQPAALGDGILSPQSQVLIQALGRTNQLIVKAYRADIERLKQLIDKLDSYVEPVTQNYQLTYIDASEIFTGLERILNLDVANTRSQESRDKSQGLTLISKTNSILLTGPPSSHRIMSSIVESIDKPNTYETGMIRIYKIENADVDEVAKTITELLEADSKEQENTSKVDFSKKGTPASQNSSSGSFAQSEEFVPQIEARVSVSKSTNSIVVQATSRQHRELEKLIEELDTRRRQVLIEAKIVEITTTDNLDLGVELNHTKADISLFTQFGLSKDLDPVTGNRSVIVSDGGTAAVLKPDQIQVILHALKTDSNIRISSAPQILVNDNSAGQITSVAERPYTTVNQGQNSDQTSFAGFVEAGTQFAITPHISEKNFLRVEYVITLNSFTGSSSDSTVPPPRSTSSITSEATVPDGYTIVVGGLQRVDDTETVNKVPFLGDLPILEWAFKSTKKEKTNKTIFLFITPTILANEGFEDLKQVSDIAIKKIEADKVSNQQKDITDVNTTE